MEQDAAVIHLHGTGAEAGGRVDNVGRADHVGDAALHGFALVDGADGVGYDARVGQYDTGVEVTDVAAGEDDVRPAGNGDQTRHVGGTHDGYGVPGDAGVDVVDGGGDLDHQRGVDVEALLHGHAAGFGDDADDVVSGFGEDQIGGQFRTHRGGHLGAVIEDRDGRLGRCAGQDGEGFAEGLNDVAGITHHGQAQFAALADVDEDVGVAGGLALQGAVGVAEHEGEPLDGFAGGYAVIVADRGAEGVGVEVVRAGDGRQLPVGVRHAPLGLDVLPIRVAGRVIRDHAGVQVHVAITIRQAGGPLRGVESDRHGAVVGRRGRVGGDELGRQRGGAQQQEEE